MKKPLFFLMVLTFGFLLLTPDSFSQNPGSLDTTFQMGVGANNYIYATAVQSDGKILIGGNFTSCNGTAINRIARLNSDRTLDTTFNVGTGVNGSVLSVAIQSDGKIIIVGYIISYNGTAVNHIARLNINGTIDTTFNQGSGANNSLLTTVIQNNGKIIIGGAFTAYNGTSRNHVARLNTDGTLDTTFNVPSTVSSTGGLHSLSIQSDGKIIIGGTFAFNNIGGRVARLNINGSIDSTFALGFGIGANNDVYTTAIQNDGKIIVGGAFSSYGTKPRSYIARVNSDGYLDTTFVVGSGTDQTILTTQIQSDGKIIIGGYFTIYNGDSINRIARLYPNGAIDATFNNGLGANQVVWASSMQNDGKIIIGGGFNFYDGDQVNYIARLNGDETPTNLKQLTNIFNQITIYPNPAINRLSIVNIKGPTILRLFNSLGELVIKKEIESDTSIDTSFLIQGIYLIEAEDRQGKGFKKVVVSN